MARILLVIFLVLAFYSCKPDKNRSIQIGNSYFDLKGYFGGEAARYAAEKPAVQKAVAINGKIETKKMVIKDWPRELAVFIDADINKSAWKGAFKVEKLKNGVRYTTTNKKIPIRKVSVFKQAEKINNIEIIIANHNLLYQSNDTLTYYPDSAYQIIKRQKIKLLDVKRYKISGRIEE